MVVDHNAILSRKNVTLSLLNQSHFDELAALALDKRIWEFAPRSYDYPVLFKEKWFDKAIQKMTDKERIAFVIFCDGRIIGSSSYYEIDDENKKLNLGYTWFHPACWGTNINALSKLIMLEHAFEVMDVNRAGFSVDSINERSLKALMKLGIKREGVLRNHLILPNNRIRHSAMLSVIREEWPETKRQIEAIVG